jgi:hypothetical protein
VIELRDKETGDAVGEVTEEQLQFLMDELEEEDAQDVDYFLNRATLEMLAERGMDAELAELLDEALGDREEMEIEWSRR